MHTLEITRPDDWHLHLRDGELLRAVVGASAAHFSRALVMPNLVPPVVTRSDAIAYRERIMAALGGYIGNELNGPNAFELIKPNEFDETSADSSVILSRSKETFDNYREPKFNPLMTLYLTNDTKPEDVARAAKDGVITAVKLYPAGATTNSQSGVRTIGDVMPVLEVMARESIPLCVHGEVTDEDIDIFDREAVFIDRELIPLRQHIPELRIVMEHVTTSEGVSYVSQSGDNIAATITTHHLIINRNHLLAGGIRSHYYCLPVAKRESHQEALIKAATSGEKSFFLGTDSAPHLDQAKLSPCGCAGIYTAPNTMACLAQVFENEDAIDKLEAFTSFNGADFYGVERNTETITLERSNEPAPPPVAVKTKKGSLTVFDPGIDVNWRVVNVSPYNSRKRFPSIMWFRQDLRLIDNPALVAASKLGEVIPVYILDDENAGQDKLGAASRVWLHYSLQNLKERLGGALCVMRGDATKLLPKLVAQTGAKTVLWNRCYESWRTKQETKIKIVLKMRGVRVESYKAALLWEPGELKMDDGTQFVGYYRSAMRHVEGLRPPLPAPKLAIAKTMFKNGTIPESHVDDLNLLSKSPWEAGVMKCWQPGEKAAMKELKVFATKLLDRCVSGHDARDAVVAKPASRLLLHLHFGEVSPFQIQMWYAAMKKDRKTKKTASKAVYRLMCLRNFQTSLLYHNPEIGRVNFQREFDWRGDDALLASWQEGRTGFPVVDAAMRELSRTGYMHDHMRMVVRSFLVKKLQLHWHHGEAWFLERLLDADHANNAVWWQRVAGCGTDADTTSDFSTFNPALQVGQFEANAQYTRRFVPELAELPDKHIHTPWLAPQEVLDKAGVYLGKNYPHPVVDLGKSHDVALGAL